VLNNEDLGSVITWDFDVLRHGVSFSVFRTKTAIPSVPCTPNGTMQNIQNAMPENSEHKSIIDKSWKEGHDYFRVESTTICHDGESVQVSIVLPLFLFVINFIQMYHRFPFIFRARM